MRFVRVTGSAALFVLLGATLPAYAQRQDERQGGDERQGRPEKQRRAQDARRNEQNRPGGEQQQRSEGRIERAPQGQERRAQERPEGRIERRETRVPQAREQREQQRGEPGRRVEQRRVQQADRPQPQYRQDQGSRQARPQRTREDAAAWQQQRGWVKQGGWQGHSTWQQNRAQHWENEHRTWAQRGGYGGYYIPDDRFRLHFGRSHWFRMRSRPVIYRGYPRFEYSGFQFLLVDPWPEYWAEDWYDTDDVYIDYDDGYYLYNRRHPSIRLAITVAF